MECFTSSPEGTKAGEVTAFYCPSWLEEVTHIHIPEGALSRTLRARERKRQQEEWELWTTGADADAVAALPTHLESHSRLFEFTVEQTSRAEVDWGVCVPPPTLFPLTSPFFSRPRSAALRVGLSCLECLCCGLTCYEMFLAYGNDL